MTATVSQRTAANRRLLADFFDSLDAEQLARPSLCAQWSVREVLAHLVMPFTVGIRRLLLETVRKRGSIDRASTALARDIAGRDVSELTARLRDRAEQRVPAPGVGPMGQMADGCIHLRDCARPLGLPADVTLDDWRMVLDWLPTKQASRGVVPRGRLDGLQLRATDQDWSWGTGLQLSGPSEALAMSLAGRRAALGELSGPGLELLAGRLGA